MIIDYGIEWSDDYQIIGLDEVMIISDDTKLGA
jgi:hypothetical protein